MFGILLLQNIARTVWRTSEEQLGVLCSAGLAHQITKVNNALPFITALKRSLSFDILVLLFSPTL